MCLSCKNKKENPNFIVKLLILTAENAGFSVPFVLELSVTIEKCPAGSFHQACLSKFPLHLQIDLLIQETSRLLQLTLEHDPHAQRQDGGSSEANEQTNGPLCSPQSENPSPTLPITQPPLPNINNLKSRIIT